ncbi:MAG: hypothetical protein K8953_05285 [Proteobacteria bacterium]|nr:hypothetical protein [Pseudomonadota bacterium]
MMEIPTEIVALIGGGGFSIIGGMFLLLRSDIKAMRTQMTEQGLAIARLEAVK